MVDDVFLCVMQGQEPRSVSPGFGKSHPTKPVGAQVQTHAVEHHGQILSRPHRGGGSVRWASAWRTDGAAHQKATSATIYNINLK